MQNRQLYADILGIEALGFVERGELKLTEGEAPVHLGYYDVAG
jgi:hypothetical protein